MKTSKAGTPMKQPQGRTAPPGQQKGFTLIELLVATALTTIILAVLLSLFNTSSKVLMEGQATADVFTEARASIDFLQKDLESVIGSRDSAYSNLPIANAPISSVPHSVHIGATLSSNAHPLAKRHFLPFEVNRVHGTLYDQNDIPTPNSTGTAVTTGKALANAVSEGTSYHPQFSALSFITQTPRARQVQTDIERGSDFMNESWWNDRESKNWGDVCVAGYYVAYTYDSPIPGARATMKLHRHFRDSGSNFAGDSSSSSFKDKTDFWWIRKFNYSTEPVQSRAHILIAKLGEVSKPLYQKSVFDNKTLPFLMKPVSPFGSGAGNLDIIEPFPINPAPDTPTNSGADYSSLEAVPPPESYGTRDHWNQNDIYYPMPDEPIAFNVVRFSAVPLKFKNTWLQSGTKTVLTAQDVNNALATYGITVSTSNEWPVVITPDLVDIELMVIDDATASLFETKQDWLNWESTPHLNRLVKANAKTFKTRIQVRSAEWSTL